MSFLPMVEVPLGALPDTVISSIDLIVLASEAAREAATAAKTAADIAKTAADIAKTTLDAADAAVEEAAKVAVNIEVMVKIIQDELQQCVCCDMACEHHPGMPCMRMVHKSGRITRCQQCISSKKSSKRGGKKRRLESPVSTVCASC